MQHEKCDLVVRFDEENGRLVYMAVQSARMDALFQQPHAGWIAQLAELRALGHEEAESLVGLKVLRELDRYSSSGLQLRNFEHHEQEKLQANLATLEQRANSGEPTAQLEAFQALWNQALKQKSLPLLERADEFLSAAVGQNFPPAVALAAAWPKLKLDALHSIAKGAP